MTISGYRAWKRGGVAERKGLTDPQVLALIQAIHAELKGAYGSPRMVRELQERGFCAGKERVERLMRENRIHARHKRRYKVTTNSRRTLPVAENLLARHFTPTAPNQACTPPFGRRKAEGTSPRRNPAKKPNLASWAK